MEWEEASRIARECIAKAKEGAGSHKKILGTGTLSATDEELFEAGLAWELAMWVRRYAKQMEARPASECDTGEGMHPSEP